MTTQLAYKEYAYNEYFRTKLPSHWDEKRLSLVAKGDANAFVDGPFGSDLKSSEYEDDGVPLIQLNNIRDGKHLLQNLKFVSQIKREQLARHIAVEGDIAIAKMAEPVARAAMVSGGFPEYVIVADCVKLTADPSKVQLSYLVWAINSDFVRINAELVSTGTTRIRVNLSELKKLKIPFPPFEEQVKIANFLDHEAAKIDTLIDKQQQLIKLLKEKRQAVISHAVTKGLNPDAPMKDSGVEWLGEVPEHWKISPLKFQTMEMQTGPFGSQLHSEDYVDDGIPLINPAHMIDGHIVPSSSCTVDRDTQVKLSRHKLKEGDLILARRGELGRCAVIKPEHVGWLCGTGSLKATLINSLRPDYAYMLISSEGVKVELSLESKGSTMENLNTETLGNIRLPVPPTGEQDEILQFVSEIDLKYDRLQGLAIEQIDLLKERRTALISAAVTGKIDVRNWKSDLFESRMESING
jgi:type I restriction enzyme S subunit